MKRLEFLKGITALAILATAYNTHFDLIRIPKKEELHIALSVLCFLLFLLGLYHDRLSRQTRLRTLRTDHRVFPYGRQASQDLLFREGLIAFLLFIPVIPALLRFPEQPYLGLALFLFPLHGMIRGYRIQRMLDMELLIGEDRVAFPLRSTRSILYQELRRVEIKYEYLYFILKDDRVECLPLEFLAERKQEALDLLGEKLASEGISGSEQFHEGEGASNSSV